MTPPRLQIMSEADETSGPDVCPDLPAPKIIFAVDNNGHISPSSVSVNMTPTAGQRLDLVCSVRRAAGAGYSGYICYQPQGGKVHCERLINEVQWPVEALKYKIFASASGSEPSSSLPTGSTGELNVVVGDGPDR